MYVLGQVAMVFLKQGIQVLICIGKTTADGHVTLAKLHITLLAASNSVSSTDLHFPTNSINNYFSHRTL